jgi:hypothetical protein
MRQVLGELELLSHGAVQRYDKTGGDSDAAASLTAAPHEHWRAEYVAAADDFDRERAIFFAQQTLVDWRGYGRVDLPNLPSDAQILAAQVLEVGADWPAADVARRLRCTITYVRRVRAAAGVVDVGEIVVTVEHVDAARMRDLSARGMTVAQIAMLTHSTRGDVHKALKRRGA